LFREDSLKLSAKEFEERIKQFREKLKDTGVKITPQRLEIFREILNSGDHPDAETIHKRVSEKSPSISQDTVYRTLWMLTDLGLITTRSSSCKTRFEPNLSSHHHFVCTKCGMTRDFYSEDFDSLSIPESAKAFGQVQKAQVEVKGICTECLKRS
jgi:Fur family peroxide stress response transcriptional regulator